MKHPDEQYAWDLKIIPRFNHQGILMAATPLGFVIILLIWIYGDKLTGYYAIIPIAGFLLLMGVVGFLTSHMKCPQCGHKIHIKHVSYSPNIHEGIILRGLKLDQKSMWQRGGSYTVYSCKNCQKRAVASYDNGG